MTKREFASLIIKLLGVYTILQILPYVSFFIGAIFNPVENGPHTIQLWLFVLSLTSFLIYLTAIIFLFAKTDYIVGLLVKSDGDIHLPAQLSGPEFQAICFAVVGVWVFFLGIPRFFQLFTELWYMSSYRSDPRVISRQWQSGIVAAIQCGLAVILFFRARSLANFWHRIQAKFEVPRPKD